MQAERNSPFLLAEAYRDFWPGDTVTEQRPVFGDSSFGSGLKICAQRPPNHPNSHSLSFYCLLTRACDKSKISRDCSGERKIVVSLRKPQDWSGAKSAFSAWVAGFLGQSLVGHRRSLKSCTVLISVECRVSGQEVKVPLRSGAQVLSDD